MQRAQKAEIIATLETEFSAASSMIVADYRGLSVAQLAQVRNDLRPLEANLRVVKNTLGRIAAERSDVAGLDELMRGPTAVAFCRADPAPVAKKLQDVARETRVLALRGGLVEGRVLDADGVRTLATLPSRDVLVAQLVGGLAAPIQSFVNVLAALPRNLVVTLDQVRQQKEQAAA
jgi:large subunit ribosomal protein L10